VAHDIRDSVVDFVNYWQERSEVSKGRLVGWIGLSRSKYYDWCERYGKVNEHNAWIPRDHWLEPEEKRAIIEYYLNHQGDGYRRLTFMMLDDDIAAASPASVLRVLKEAGLMGKRQAKPSQKGKGFEQPLSPHEHWHIDVSYININGTFYYLCTVLDGYSRYVLHWDLRESMTEADVELILEAAKEKFPGVTPRIISDNGPQFIAKDFKQFIRISGMTHVRTSPFYPQSNGKLERWHGTLKQECIRPKTPLSLQDAMRIVGQYVEHYNEVRLHSAIGYVAPLVKLEGREKEVFAERDRKLKEAREARKIRRQNARAASNAVLH
jgi:transposase InsO family protein